MVKVYVLTPAQAEELLQRLPSHTKGQRKEIGRIMEGIMALEDGEHIQVYIEDGSPFAMMKGVRLVKKDEWNYRMIGKELPVSVVRKYMEMKKVPCFEEQENRPVAVTNERL